MSKAEWGFRSHTHIVTETKHSHRMLVRLTPPVTGWASEHISTERERWGKIKDEKILLDVGWPLIHNFKKINPKVHIKGSVNCILCFHLIEKFYCNFLTLMTLQICFIFHHSSNTKGDVFLLLNTINVIWNTQLSSKDG